MATEAGPLGSLLDIGTAIVPVDSQSGAMTGKRLYMGDCEGVLFVVFKAAGTANDDPVLDVQEHNASTAGTTADLDVVTEYFIKQETTLDNDETWTRVTQAATSEVTLNATSAETEMIVVIDIKATDLSSGYAYTSLNIADTGSAGAQLISALYIPYGLKVQRKPENLAALLR
jgi:hypothetical protein